MTLLGRLGSLFRLRSGFPEPDLSRDRIAEAPGEYLERLEQFCNVLAACMRVSRQYGGFASPTARHFFGSVLFTALCTRGASLAFIAPYSTWAKRDFEHWDYASTANIARTILETRLNFYYLCVDPCSESEWGCRWNVFNLHDCTARIALFEAMPSGEAQVTGLREQAEELRERLRQNEHFQSLVNGTQRAILKGGKAHLFPLQEIAERAGMDLEMYRWMWKLMSSHVHALPMSFYRMEGNERGRGVQTTAEEEYTTLMLSFCTTLLLRSRNEFAGLMNGLDKSKRLDPAYAADERDGSGRR